MDETTQQQFDALKAQVAQNTADIAQNTADIAALKSTPPVVVTPFYGRMARPADLLTRVFDGEAPDGLPPTRDVNEIIARAPYGWTWAGSRAHSADELDRSIYPYLETAADLAQSGAVPDDMKLPNGDVMFPETYAFAYLTGVAITPAARAASFGAGHKPTELGPLTLEQAAAKVSSGGDPSGR